MNGIRQHDEKDCGIACIATICKKYGLKIPLVKLREWINVDRNGITLYSIANSMKKLGFSVEVLQGDLNELFLSIKSTEITMPFIAHIKQSKYLQHYIVIRKIKDKKVYAFDPARGKRKYSIEEFESCWTGYIVNCVPREDFKKRNLYQGFYKIYITILLKQKKVFSLVAIFSVLMMILSVMGAFAYKVIIDNWILGTPVENGGSIDRLLFHDGKIYFLGALILLYIFGAVFDFVRSTFLTLMSKKMEEDLFNSFVERTLYLPLKFFVERDTGEVLSRFSSISEIENILSRASLEIILDFLMALGGGGILFFVSPHLFYVTLSVVAIYLLVVYLYKGILKKYNYEIMELNEDLLCSYKEVIDGIETIKCLNKEEFFLKKIKQEIISLLNVSKKRNIISNSQSSLLLGTENVGMVCIICLGSYLAMRGYISLGTLISFEVLVQFFITPIQGLAQLQPEIQVAFSAMTRLNDVLLAEREYQNKGVNICKKGDIVLSNITFGYEQQTQILNDITMSIKEGEKVALIGRNGCGKSTLIKLLYAFYKPTKGKIKIGGYSIDEIGIKELRNIIAFVPQETYLFQGTINENLLMGIDYVDMEWMDRVLEGCSINELIKKMPYGLDTIVGEKGYSLSSGERQRIAIARAILKKPIILLMDESTSNLDIITEKKIYDFISISCKHTTCIYINHRIESLSECDEFIEIINGRIKIYEKYKDLNKNCD